VSGWPSLLISSTREERDVFKPRWDVSGTVRGPLAPYGVAFWEEMIGRGYTVRSAETHLFLMARLSRWMDEVSVEPSALDQARVEEFLWWNHTASPFPKSARGAVPLIDFLRGLGLVPLAPVAVLTADEELLARFRLHLLGERGLTGGTAWNYEHAGRLFLGALDSAGRGDLEQLTAADVSAFVVSQCRRGSVAAAKNLVNGLRAMLRFLHFEGITPGSLSGAVPTVAGWTGGGLPRGVDAKSVKALIDSCDRRTAKGRRDFAILMLLAVLGLRAGEVVALDIDDIDWSRGELVVRGKANRVELMPLRVDVGEAVAGYLKRGRPQSGHRALFVGMLAPRRRLTVGGISVVVHAACERAGLEPIATHRLRHTVASELLRHGAGLAEIRQVLRHRSAAATARYAKVETAALRQIARPWPGSAT
jgi:integrase/recombinase XerD